jgi:hypothetical protein
MIYATHIGIVEEEDLQDAGFTNLLAGAGVPAALSINEAAN